MKEREKKRIQDKERKRRARIGTERVSKKGRQKKKKTVESAQISSALFGEKRDAHFRTTQANAWRRYRRLSEWIYLC